jgi:coenzyme F420 hydrogenase subunit delta
MEHLPEYCRKKILIVGCGNRLFGDDGFGPAVVDYLAGNYTVPDEVCLLDVGTGVRKILFTISLSEIRPESIVVIDAVDRGREPGDVFEIPLDDIPVEKIDDFSMHQVPSSNLLKELKDLCSVDVRVVACQVGEIPEEIREGLSAPVKKAIPGAAQMIADKYFNRSG